MVTRSRDRAAQEAGARPGAGPQAGSDEPPIEASGGAERGKPAGERLLSIGAAAARAGVTERALRYYQEIGILSPSGHTKGGMRRYSEEDLARVVRIRELQQLLGYNLDEIAAVLRNEDRWAEIRAAYRDQTTDRAARRLLLEESLGLATELRETVEAKRSALEAFLVDLDARLARIHAALEELGADTT
jgi:DNA-binding transcriptional MerR regulator